MKNIEGYNPILRYEAIATLANLECNKCIIDCSCGRGIEGVKIIEQYKPQMYYGIDMNKRVINMANDLNPSKDNCFYVVGDILKICVKSADYFLCIETLEHLSEKDNYLAADSISSSLILGGKLLVSVPGNPENAMEDPRHKQMITKEKLLKMFIDFKLIYEELYIKFLPEPDRYSSLYVLIKER